MEKSGDKVATGKDGNTTSSPSRKNNKSVRDSDARIWNCNIPYEHASEESLKTWLKLHCKSAIWQAEKGNETGYEHWNITFHLLKKQRLSWLKNHFCKFGHFEKARNIDAAFDYACKEDTRIEGPYYWPEPLKKPIKDPMIGKTFKDWQIEILNIIKTEPDTRTINWYWSRAGNIGKTSFCKHLVLKHKASYLNGKKNDVLYAISNNIPTLAVVNIARSLDGLSKPYSWLEDIKDGLVFSGKYKSGSLIFDSPHIFVFANSEPEYARLSKDRWNVKNIDEIIEDLDEEINHLDYIE